MVDMPVAPFAGEGLPGADGAPPEEDGAMVNDQFGAEVEPLLFLATTFQ